MSEYKNRMVHRGVPSLSFFIIVNDLFPNTPISWALFTINPQTRGSKWGQNFSARGINSPLWAKKRIKKHRNHVISVPFWQVRPKKISSFHRRILLLIALLSSSLLLKLNYAKDY